MSNLRYTKVACRNCGAGVGIMCKAASGREASQIHASRIEAFVEAFNASNKTVVKTNPQDARAMELVRLMKKPLNDLTPSEREQIKRSRYYLASTK